MYDVVIIGSGVSGSAAARELSRFPLNICVLEKEEDVCCGTSKANSAIVHAGFDAEPGSLMAELNVRGNAMMDQLSKELDIPFKRIGSLVLCQTENDLPALQNLYRKGLLNGVPDLRILTREEVLEMEPNLADPVYAALYAPTGGIICPFELNLALAENAFDNGVKFQFDTRVDNIEKTPKGFLVHTSKGTIETKYIVNAAGVYADVFHNMVSQNQIHITPRKGEYILLDKTAGNHVSHTLFSLPGKYGKGVLVTPTVHGNLLLGPTGTDIEDKEGTNTTRSGLDEVLTKAAEKVQNLPFRQTITSFAGLRACETHHEFIIEELPDAPGFIDCAGIESPGLSSCPAIGERVAEIFRKKLSLTPKENFRVLRKGLLKPDTLSFEERAALIKEHPEYGTIVCRCEGITEGEILEAIHRPLPARSLDGIKRRTRAGMGRCQAGFCSPRTMEILTRELAIDLTEVTKCGGSSQMVLGHTKQEATNENL